MLDAGLIQARRLCSLQPFGSCESWPTAIRLSCPPYQPPLFVFPLASDIRTAVKHLEVILCRLLSANNHKSPDDSRKSVVLIFIGIRVWWSESCVAESCVCRGKTDSPVIVRLVRRKGFAPCCVSLDLWAFLPSNLRDISLLFSATPQFNVDPLQPSIPAVPRIQDCVVPPAGSIAL